MLAGGAQHDDAHPRILVERLEDQAELIALFHLDDVERRPVEHDIGAFALRIDLDAKAVELLQARIGKSVEELMQPFLGRVFWRRPSWVRIRRRRACAATACRPAISGFPRRRYSAAAA